MRLDRDPEWRALCAEHAAARERLVGAVDSIGVRMRDPFGIKGVVARHPFLTAGVAAGAGAVLVNILLPRDGADDAEPDADDVRRGARRAAPFLDTLREQLVRMALPWLAALLARYLGETPAEPVAGRRVPAASDN